MQYRIGINLGDILIEGDDILGDGVNVAARLEGLAEPSGICISSSMIRFERSPSSSTIWANTIGRLSLSNCYS
jgi:class 3 adenylate cyclase